MAIHYVPDAAGWNDNGVYGAAAQLRLKLDSSYDAAANRSTLTVTLEGRAPGFGGSFLLLDNALLRLNGGTFFSGGGSGTASLGCRVQFAGDEAWHALCDVSSGEALRWTLQLEHDAQGRAEAEVNVTARLYRDEQVYFTFYGLSGTAVLEEARQFSLTVSAGTGCTVRVLCGGQSILPGVPLAWGDRLQILFSPLGGYEIVSQTVNGAPFPNGAIHTVTGDVAVAAEARSGNYPLSISAGPGCSVTVYRDGQTLSDGARLHDEDRLQILFAARPGYELVTHTVNGRIFLNGGLYIVSGPVTVEAAARRVGLLRLDTGSGIVPCRVLLDTGSANVPVRLFLDLGERYTEV